MKKYLIAAVVVSMFYACNNKEQEMQAAKLKTVSADDSVVNIKNKSQDSTITSYVKSMNDIEDNLDSIKARANIMTVNSGSSENGDKKTMIIADMQYIGNLMMQNKETLDSMRRKLAASGTKNAQLKKMIKRLNKEIIEKDSEIVSLKGQLAESNTNLSTEIKKFDDSMKVISRQQATISQENTVYYAIGTAKELKNKGVIVKQGGVLGIGSTKELKTNTNTSYFTSVDSRYLNGLPLFSKFDKLITTHPNGSYRVKAGTKTDSLIITDPKLFWSESKYLVVTVKPK